MSTPTPTYDHYGDMLETHNEIGYLLVILSALAVFVVFLLGILWWWPQEDVYLVPGTTVFGEAGVIWNIPPPEPGSVAIPIVQPSAALTSSDVAAPAVHAAASSAPVPAVTPDAKQPATPSTPKGSP